VYICSFRRQSPLSFGNRGQTDGQPQSKSAVQGAQENASLVKDFMAGRRCRPPESLAS